MKKNVLIAGLAHLAAMRPLLPGDDEISLNISYGSIDDVPEAFRPLYKADESGAVTLSNIVGLKTQEDVNNVSGALNKERNEHGQTRSRLNALLGGRTVEEVQADLDELPALRAGQQGAGNVDEQVQARLLQHTAPLQRELDTSNETVKDLKAQVAQYQQREQQRVVGDAIRTGAASTKMLQEAVGDVEFMAQAIFEVNENNQVVAKEGIPGVTPGISPEVWLTDLKQKKPFYWPQSVVAGGKGGTGAPGGNNPWAKDTWNMTQQGVIYAQDPKKAEQLAAQAGTTVGGLPPQ